MTDAPAANQKAADRLADIREQMRRCARMRDGRSRNNLSAWMCV
jgi:hypothetical protein